MDICNKKESKRLTINDLKQGDLFMFLLDKEYSPVIFMMGNKKRRVVLHSPHNREAEGNIWANRESDMEVVKVNACLMIND